MSRRREAYLLGFVLLAALAVRIFYLDALGRTPFFRFPVLDAEYYLSWAAQLAAGGGASFQGNPFYPWLLRFFLASGFDPDWAIRIFQLLLGLGTAGLLFSAGRSLLGSGWAAVAAAAYAFYPGSRFYEGWFLTAALETFWAAALAAALLPGEGKPPGPGRAARAGVLAGLGFLTRPGLLPLGAALWLATREKRKKSLVLFAGGVLAVVFFFRAAAIPGGSLPAHAGENFYLGNNPGANGTGRIPEFARSHPQYQHLDFRLEASRRAGRSLGPAEASRFWLFEGLRWIGRNPLSWLRLTALKAGLFFSGAEFPDNYHPVFFGRFLPLWGSTRAWRLLSALALAGMVLARRKRDFSPLYFLTAAGAAGPCLFFVTSRMRQPLVPFLCLFAAEALSGGTREARDRRWGRLGGRIILATALWFLLGLGGSGLSPESYSLPASEVLYRSGDCQGALILLSQAQSARELNSGETPSGYEKRLRLARGKCLLALDRQEQAQEVFALLLAESRRGRELARDLFEVANAHAARDRHEQAVELYLRAREEDPGFAPVLNNLGLSLKKLGRREEAEAAFREAIRRDPLYPHALVNLGNIHLDREEWARAETAYRAALALEPGLVQARYTLAYVLRRQEKIPEARSQIELLPADLRKRIKLRGH